MEIILRENITQHWGSLFVSSIQQNEWP